MFTKAIDKQRFLSTEVLTTLFLPLLALLITSGLQAETKAAPEGSLSHSLDTFDFTLSNENKYCQLEVKNKSGDETKTIPLLLDAPCYWIVNSSKALLHYGYESVGVDNTLLIAGTPLDWSAEKMAYQKLPENTYCSQYLQGIIISKDQVQAVHEKIVAAHCETGLAIDEKIFYAMAHNPARYQEKLVETALDTANAITTPTIKAAKKNPSPIEVKSTEAAEKSFLDTVTDSLMGLFSGTESGKSEPEKNAEEAATK